MTSVWIVVPTYDEAANVAGLVGSLLALPLDARRTVLIVDDDSPDGTGRIADGLAAAHPEVRVLHRRERTGLAGAYRAGFELALACGADVVVQMDADRSHDPGDVPRLVEAVAAGADLAIGSRYVDGGGTADWGASRRLLSRAGGAYARLILGGDVRDLTGGFKAWRGDALRRLDLEQLTADGYAFQIEMTHLAQRRGMTVRELPITFRDRVHGESKMSAGIALEAVWRVPALRLAHHGPRAGCCGRRSPEPEGHPGDDQQGRRRSMTDRRRAVRRRGRAVSGGRRDASRGRPPRGRWRATAARRGSR